MSSPEDRGIEPFDWFNRFFGGSSRRRGGEGFFGFPDIFRGFDEMRTEMEREFEEQFKDIENIAPGCYDMLCCSGAALLALLF